MKERRADGDHSRKLAREVHLASAHDSDLEVASCFHVFGRREAIWYGYEYRQRQWASWRTACKDERSESSSLTLINGSYSASFG